MLLIFGINLFVFVVFLRSFLGICLNFMVRVFVFFNVWVSEILRGVLLIGCIMVLLFMFIVWMLIFNGLFVRYIIWVSWFVL